MPAPAPLAWVDELADWIGESIDPGSPEGKRALMCLRIASALVRQESGRVWAEADGRLTDDIPEAAVLVTLYCASRVFDNRNAQTQGGLDDYSESWKVDESGAYLTASEKRMLASLKTPSFGGLGTIGTTRGGFPPATAGLVPTGTPDVEFPWY